MVLPIYGLGGMGKSTLAKLVYNDTQFTKYDHRVWVYVSQEFDLKKIGRSIISQLPTKGGQQNTDTLELIYQCMKDLFPGKKILIVLDDIWEEDDFKLKNLKSMLDKTGSMIDVIVTTRQEGIANKICTNVPYKLEPLEDNICWDIIKRYSGFKDKTNKGELEKIGLDIAKKCGGVPLAAQAIGYVLKSKDLHGWSDLNNSDIWNESSRVDKLPHEKVLPSLKLSYEWMLPIPRLCFSYCAIFPKGHDINENDLIYSWVSLDFIKNPSEGQECIKHLLGMSFLHHSKLPSISEKHVARYNMHDLVHDLARSVIGDELIVIDATDAKKKSNSSEQLKYCRYVLLTNYDGQTKLSNILPKKVRALHFSGSSKLGLQDGLFSSTKCLRVLDFSGCSSAVLPVSIGLLNQLKCLIAPKLQNEKLPESIADQLSKLQYLNMRGSSLISELPSFGNLGSLLHLDMSGCSDMSILPESFGDLKRMVHLDMSGCSEITELPVSLGNLTNLQHLDLSQCSRLTAIPESGCSLVALKYLDISYCSIIQNLPESFKNLRSLLHLDMRMCLHMSDGQLSRVLCGLTALQYLNMSCIIQSDGRLYYNAMRNLTNLEHLDISYNDDLECLPESIGKLKKLHTLNISYCWKLKSLPDCVSEIATLKSLLIEGCSDELIDQVSSRVPCSLTLLPLFKVRVDAASACSNLPDLECVNVGELRICSLENVRFLEEACKIKLSDKTNLSTLVFAWTRDVDRSLDDKDLLGQLEPPKGLKQFSLECYSSPSVPSWLMNISDYLPNLVDITLDSLLTCSNLPPLGQLQNLKKLNLDSCPSVTKINKSFCGGKRAFRQLSTFIMHGMIGLQEWTTTYSVEDGDVEEFMFPVLDNLYIWGCPKLRLKPCPPTFRVCNIIRSCQVISSLAAAGGSHLTSSARTTEMVIRNIDSQGFELFHHFPALQELEICSCYKLQSLPVSTRHLASLKSLELVNCEDISALPEWLGDLSSLKSLSIERCPSIKSLPQSIQRLTKLQELSIMGNKELKQWCESEENKKLLAHIKNVDYKDC